MTAQDYFNQIRSIASADGMPSTLSTLIAAQAAHETANFTSRVFVQNNNCFGYKAIPGAIWQEGSGRMSPEGNAYALYSSVANSVHELTAWIRRRQKEGKFPPDLTTITTPLGYASLLKVCGYYGDTTQNYTAGLAAAINRYSTVA